jgi:hypothetical protein
MITLTAKQITQINRINWPMIDLEFGVIINDLIQQANNATAVGTPVNAVDATNILTLAGVVIDGETVTINLIDIYEFCADVAQSVTTVGNIPVDITAVTTASTGTLTIDTQVTSGNTMTIGGKVYTFVPDGTDNADGEITIGTDLATGQAAVVAAINGTDAHNTANASVSSGAFAANDAIITALIGGVAGDAIDTTETFTAVTNIFAAGTLGSGADCTAANAITALVAAVTASDTQGVGAADGAGDTVDLTADAGGVAGNAITTTEVMANASFATATLASGVDGTVGVLGQDFIDATYIYKLMADNTIADANWTRHAHGGAY